MFWKFSSSTRKVKEGNKGFHILRGFFKATTNYRRQKNNIKEEAISTINFTSLFWISKDGNKDPGIFKMKISFMLLFKL